ncbi:MAG: hypothetical protein AMJ81_03015 [Phycisphaerae bacterium SM23_33]|nr:MAG: hypothetical protein AMJ81_03015 [Phycisphaerae bacterium SM23_33]
MLKRVVLAAAFAILPSLGASPVLGQAAAPAKLDVLQRVPAGCTGFAVVTGAGATAAKFDAFVKLLGSPEEPVLPAPVLELMQSQTKMGKGFNPEGGFAAVMLDLKQYGLEPAELAAAIRQGKPLPSRRLPLVMLIPGRNPAEMFALRKPTTQGDLVQFEGQDKNPRYCLQAGAHVALGANLQAVRAVAAGLPPPGQAGGESVLKRLSAADKAFIADNDVTVWMDPAKGGPTLAAAIAALQKRFEPAEGAQMPARVRLMRAFATVTGAAGPFGDALNQMDAFALGLRFESQGLLAELRCSFRPDSMLGKALAACKAAEGNPFDRLPNMPYVLALSRVNQPRPPKEWAAGRVETALSQEPLKSLPEEAKARYRRAALGLGEQIRSVQLYFGTVSGEGGMARMACVLECASAGETRKLLAEFTAVAGEALGTSKDQTIGEVLVKYEGEAVRRGGKDADAITLKAPAGSERNQKEMHLLLASESLRLLVAEADEKTLVITLGGGSDFLTKAMQSAAKRSGRLARDPAVAKALAMLPPKRVGTAVVNAKNLQVLLKAIKAATGGKIIPVDIASEVPFAAGIWADGAELRISLRLPTETARDLVKLYSAALE